MILVTPVVAARSLLFFISSIASFFIFKFLVCTSMNETTPSLLVFAFSFSINDTFPCKNVVSAVAAPLINERLPSDEYLFLLNTVSPLNVSLPVCEINLCVTVFSEISFPSLNSTSPVDEILKKFVLPVLFFAVIFLMLIFPALYNTVVVGLLFSNTTFSNSTLPFALLTYMTAHPDVPEIVEFLIVTFLTYPVTALKYRIECSEVLYPVMLADEITSTWSLLGAVELSKPNTER